MNIEKIIEAAEAGGKILKDYFGQGMDTIQKSVASDFYTKADLDSEKAIFGILKKEFPDFNIFSEENGKIEKGSEYTFIIDPMDGTNNFVIGIPDFSVSIGLFKNDEAVAGVINMPIVGHTYHAEKGKGAFFNGMKLQVNDEKDIQKSTVLYSCGYKIVRDTLDKAIVSLHKINVKRILLNWSPASVFCLLASGKIEAIVNDRIELHDYAAGKLIAREAGAKVTDFEGNKERDDKNDAFIISNGTEIHEKIIKCFR
ncbi:MAG: inositol monophosphatase [Candidatus Moranbacteria bacterium]|nr:inositol monophosphatase [Candidatus Moranbacteria bacterium]